jgi:hypothetical protein
MISHHTIEVPLQTSNKSSGTWLWGMVDKWVSQYREWVKDQTVARENLKTTNFRSKRNNEWNPKQSHRNGIWFAPLLDHFSSAFLWQEPPAHTTLQTELPRCYASIHIRS